MDVLLCSSLIIKYLVCHFTYR